ncbi:MAG: hypothetical protein AVDCRST_MAG26-1116, partial [uncultured Chloroflexia bacterium]
PRSSPPTTCSRSARCRQPASLGSTFRDSFPWSGWTISTPPRRQARHSRPLPRRSMISARGPDASCLIEWPPVRRSRRADMLLHAAWSCAIRPRRRDRVRRS